jgi:hypothetical protein
MAVRTEIDRLESGDHPLPKPGAPAANDDIRRVQSTVHCHLDADFADFLRCANGWPALMVSTDLFSTDDLREDRLSRRAMGDVEAFDAIGTVSDVMGAVENLIPIAYCESYLSIVCAERHDSPRSGRIVWICGSDVQVFASFADFWQAVVLYNKMDLDDLRIR